MYSKLKNSWTFRHIQVLIIIGLMTGIGMKAYNVDETLVAVFDFSDPIVYTAEAKADECVKTDHKCLIDQMLEEYTLERFELNRSFYLEQARQEAIVDVRDVLIGRIDESPYVDYEALREEYGY